MKYFSLREAAEHAGKSKSTILRAIQSGRLRAPKNKLGGYDIHPNELSRVYDVDHELNKLNELKSTIELMNYLLQNFICSVEFNKLCEHEIKKLQNNFEMEKQLKNKIKKFDLKSR